MNEKEIISIVLDELTRRGFISNHDISFKNTEALLYSYNTLKKKTTNKRFRNRRYSRKKYKHNFKSS